MSYNTTKDSTINGGRDSQLPIVDATSIVKEFGAAVSFLRTKEWMKQLSQVIETLPKQEARIIELEHELREKEKKWDCDQTTLIQAHELRSQESRKCEDRMTAEIIELKTSRKEQADVFQKLQEENNKTLSRVRQLEQDLEERTKQSDSIETKLESAQQELKERNKKIKSMNKDLERANSDNANLQTSKTALEEQYNNLEEKENKARQELTRLRGFSTKLTARPKGIEEALSKWWASLEDLVRRTFEEDLPDNILQNDWTSFGQNQVFEHWIPLPHTNTPDAKEMRTAVLLGTIARLVNKFILQPTYILVEDNELQLRELLNNLAVLSVENENYLRSVLLHLTTTFPNDHSTIVRSRVLDDLFKTTDLSTTGLSHLLPHERASALRTTLATRITKLQEIWMPIQRSTTRLDHSFHFMPKDLGGNPSHRIDWFKTQTRDSPAKKIKYDPNGEQGFVLIPSTHPTHFTAKSPPTTSSTYTLLTSQMRAAGYEVNLADRSGNNGVRERRKSEHNLGHVKRPYFL